MAVFVIRDKRLLPHQKRLINSTKPTKVMIAGRGSGKSFVGARLIGTRLLQGYNCIVTAQTYKTLKKVLWNEVIKVLKKWGVPVKINLNEMRIELSCRNHAFVDFYTANSTTIENVRGLTNYKTWLGDEAALASREFHDVIYACLRGETNDGRNVGDPEEVLVTTPKGARNWLSRYIREMPEELIEVIHATTYDNTKLSDTYVKSLERSYSSSFARQELQGIILDDDEADQLISWHDMDLAIKLVPTTLSFGDRVLGIDMARYGDDKVDAYYRNGNKVNHTFEASKEDSFALFNRVTRLYKPTDLDIINIDNTGGSNSSGLIDLLTKAGYNVNEVNFSSKSPVPQYHNLRAFMYAATKEAIKQGMNLPDDDILLEELAAQKFKISETNGKMILIPKEEVKKVLFRSPDRSDALALTFAHVPDFDHLFFNGIDTSSSNEREENVRTALAAIASASAW